MAWPFFTRWCGCVGVAALLAPDGWDSASLVYIAFIASQSDVA